MIQTEDLSKQFGDYWAVDGVSLDVYPEQVLALLGQNGSSKTTTVRMLISVLAPTRGRARIAGFDVVQSPQQLRASVGVLTKQHGLYLRMTGLEYLDFFWKGLLSGCGSTPETKPGMDGILRSGRGCQTSH